MITGFCCCCCICVFYVTKGNAPFPLYWQHSQACDSSTGVKNEELKNTVAKSQCPNPLAENTNSLKIDKTFHTRKLSLKLGACLMKYILKVPKVLISCSAAAAAPMESRHTIIIEDVTTLWCVKKLRMESFYMYSSSSGLERCLALAQQL